MSKFIIKGGQRLRGRVRAQGSKNAAFPVITAALLGRSPSEVRNVPDIGDVRTTLAILKHLGVACEFRGHTLKIDPRRIRSRPLPRKLASRFRGSVVFAGALLARFGTVRLALPGGDKIGARPIDVHLDGFRKLGARVREGRFGIEVSGRHLVGSKLVLGVSSVTGTENLILASVMASGATRIKLAAAEPHVQNLCRFLNKMGAKIRGIGTASLTIRGVGFLRGAGHALCPDEIGAMTLAVAAAATRGHVAITGVDLAALDAPLAALERMGVNFITRADKLEIRPSRRGYRATRILTGVYPQLLTDMQPLLGVLATQARGETSIHDWIYEGRQGYLLALRKMGARVKIEDLHRAKISGPTQLRGASITTPDIRAGASILIAALIAKGRSIIYNAEIIDRGYEKIDERLRQLGADITRAD